MRCFGAPFWLIEGRAGEMVLSDFFYLFHLPEVPAPGRNEAQAVVTDLLMGSPVLRTTLIQGYETGIFLGSH